MVYLSLIFTDMLLFELLELFKEISGFKINCTKAEGMWIGSSKENKAKPFRIKWPNIPIRGLGSTLDDVARFS